MSCTECRSVSSRLQATVLAATVFLMTNLLAGCGGGVGQSSTNPVPPTPPAPPAPNFSLSLSQPAIGIAAGESSTVSVTVNGLSGGSYSVSLVVDELPPGVSVIPQTAIVPVGTTQQLTFTATAALATSAAVTISGSYGRTGQSIALDVAPIISSANRTPSRTSYIRTDAVTEYPYWTNNNWIVFEPSTNRFFVTDLASNQVMVIDAATRKQIGVIAVPGAFGIDETPDHTTLYVGTQIGDVYAIDPVGMKVVHRYISSQIGPSGFQAVSVKVLADGELVLLEGLGGQGGLASIDGYPGFAVWNPQNNSLTNYSSPVSSSCPTSPIFGIGLTGDRSQIIFAPLNTLCAFNPVSGNVHSATIDGAPIVSTPDGKSVLVLQYGIQPQISVFDAQSLTLTNSFPLAGIADSAAMVVSADSQTVFLPVGDPNGLVIYGYNLATGQSIGWTSNLDVPPLTGGSSEGPAGIPVLQAVDGTGLLAGPMEEGIGFVDTTALNTGTAPIGQFSAFLTPDTGPVAGGTLVQVPASNKLGALYFGTSQVTDIFPSSSLPGVDAITPAGLAGPITAYLLNTDGSESVSPDAFSYGPTLLETTPDTSTADGGGSGIVYGYGFSNSTSSAGIPTDLQIAIGGVPATITSFNSYAYGTESEIFPLQSANYTIPPNLAGTVANLALTTSSGTATSAAGMTYVPKLQRFPLNAAALAQGTYDQTQDLYYFTDASQIQVFSKTLGGWKTPIQIPAAPANTTHRLWGIALSPDNSKLAVSDAGTGVIYLINPASPAIVQSFPIGASSTSLGGTSPAGIAVSDSGMVYFIAQGLTETIGTGFYKLDTATGSIIAYGGTGELQSRAVISPDGAEVFANLSGSVISVNTASDAVSYATVAPNCCDYDLTLSSSSKQLEAGGYLYDTSLNADSYLVLNDREALAATYVNGAKLSPDGTLLFQPSLNGLDVYDGRLGTLRARIALPVSLSQNYDALVSDGQDNSLLAITGSTGDGVAIVDLTSLSVPPPLAYEVPVRTELHSESTRIKSTGILNGLPSPQRAVKHVMRETIH